LPSTDRTYHYRSRRAGQAHLSERTREIATTRVRYGYRRIHVLLCREGWRVNPKRVYRLYREMGLQLRSKTPKRRVKAKLRADRFSRGMFLEYSEETLDVRSKVTLLRRLQRDSNVPSTAEEGQGLEGKRIHPVIGEEFDYGLCRREHQIGESGAMGGNDDLSRCEKLHLVVELQVA